jgi:ubiquinone/menaquinone biosynthesis C-methylase UbiE
VARNATNVHFRWAEATALPFPEHSFDLVTCHDLLHYLADPEAVLAGLHRLLVADGKLLLDEIVGSDDPVKRATQETIEVRRDPAFRKLYSAPEMERLVNAAGFRIEKAERYETNRELGEWLASAAADDVTRSAVWAMFEAGLDWDAAGLNARRSRNGTLTFTQRRQRLLAAAHEARE